MKYIVESDPFPEVEYVKKTVSQQAQQIKGLQSDVKRLTTERDSWKDAWFKQRLATGKAWWEGYRKAFTYIRSSIPYSIPYLESKR